MAEREECKICREMQKQKHKYDIVWKIVAVVSTILAIIFICLYACSGSIIKETEINNNVEVDNEGQNIYTSNVGNITDVDVSEKEINQGLVIGLVLGVFVLILGGACVCYFISQNRNKQQRENQEYFKETNTKDRSN